MKFFSDAEKEALRTKLQIEEGDLIFFAAGQMGDRLRSARPHSTARSPRFKSSTATIPTQLDFLWVTDFPLLQLSAEENKWNAVHHPFTRPKAEDLPLLEAKKFGEVRAEAYDVVLNGVEIGGGSIRIHEPELQAKMFAVLGVSAEEQQAKFGHLLRAFRLGAPPHGGIALGSRSPRHADLRRAIHPRRDGVPEKQSRPWNLMTQSPAEVDPKQLRELGIQLATEKK